MFLLRVALFRVSCELVSLIWLDLQQWNVYCRPNTSHGGLPLHSPRLEYRWSRCLPIHFPYPAAPGVAGWLKSFAHYQFVLCFRRRHSTLTVVLTRARARWKHIRGYCSRRAPPQEGLQATIDCQSLATAMMMGMISRQAAQFPSLCHPACCSWTTTVLTLRERYSDRCWPDRFQFGRWLSNRTERREKLVDQIFSRS